MASVQEGGSRSEPSTGATVLTSAHHEEVRAHSELPQPLLCPLLGNLSLPLSHPGYLYISIKPSHFPKGVIW